MKLFATLTVSCLILMGLGFSQDIKGLKTKPTPITEILKELGGGPIEPSRSHFSNVSADPVVEGESSHIVANGENPWTIAKKYGVSMEALVELNGIENSRDIKVGQALKLPVPSEKKSPQVAVEENPSFDDFEARGYRVYTIQKNDNPWTIARNEKVNYEALLEINEIKNPRDLKIGQKLRLPNPGQKSAKAEALAAEAAEIAKSEPTVVPFNADGHDVYEVKKGENPWTIARKLKLNYEDFLSINDIENPRSIKIGQKLKLPKG